MPSSAQVRRVVGTVAALLVAGWSSAAAVAAPAAVRLTISASDGAGHHSSAGLSCRGGTATATGFLRGRGVAACRQARRIAGFLETKPQASRRCTEIYGGPDTARISGRVGSAGVERAFARTDGCAIADWSAAGLLLPRSRFGLGAVIGR